MTWIIWTPFGQVSGTQTALVTLLDDLWQEQDGDNASTLAFLDLLTAFDTFG